jgi:hypothetical protein
MLKTLAASILFVSPVACEDGFNDWALRYKKTYANEGLLKRAHEIWIRNAEIVQLINNNSSSTWKAGLNFFADLTAEEFADKFLMRGVKSFDFKTSTGSLIRSEAVLESQPVSYDWREHGISFEKSV